MILKTFLQLTEINIKLSDGFVVFWSHVTLSRSAEDGTSGRRKHYVAVELGSCSAGCLVSELVG